MKTPLLTIALASAAAAMLACAPLTAAAATPGVAADVTATVAGTYFGANALGSPSYALNVNALNRFTQGTTAGKADKLYANTVTVSASSSLNLDLAGVLSDPFGAALTFATVKVIYVHAWPTNANNLCIGGAASNAFVGPFADATDVVCVKPGGTALLTAPGVGWTVTAGTGDLLKATNSAGGTAVSADVVIVGTSA